MPVSAERTRAVEQTPECLRELPRGWSTAMSRHHAGRMYYVHTATGYRTLERPPEGMPTPYALQAQSTETTSPLFSSSVVGAAAASSSASLRAVRSEPPIAGIARADVPAEPTRHSRRMLAVKKSTSTEDDIESVHTSESEDDSEMDGISAASALQRGGFR